MDYKKNDFLCHHLCKHMQLLLVLPVLAPFAVLSSEFPVFMTACSVLLLQHILGPSRDQPVFVHLLAQSGYRPDQNCVHLQNEIW